MRNESIDSHVMAGTFVYRNSTLYTEFASLRVSYVCESEEQQTCRANDMLRWKNRHSEKQTLKIRYFTARLPQWKLSFLRTLHSVPVFELITRCLKKMPRVFLTCWPPRLKFCVFKSCLSLGLRHIQHTHVNLELCGVLTLLVSRLTTFHFSEYASLTMA